MKKIPTLAELRELQEATERTQPGQMIQIRGRVYKRDDRKLCPLQKGLQLIEGGERVSDGRGAPHFTSCSDFEGYGQEAQAEHIARLRREEPDETAWDD